jgi:uncharacterized protein DUF6461
VCPPYLCGPSQPAPLAFPRAVIDDVRVASDRDALGYGWLNTTTERPGAWMQDASCFYFFSGLPVAEVVERSALSRTRSIGPLRDPGPPDEFDTAVFDGGNGWTVVYQDNGVPEQFASAIAASPEVARAVIVFWNVNARTEFSYWERGDRLVSFELPEDRWGSDPDRLRADMAATVGNGDQHFEFAAEYYGRLLALAERITGVHIGPDFLDRPGLIVGETSGDEPGAADADDYE